MTQKIFIKISQWFDDEICFRPLLTIVIGIIIYYMYYFCTKFRHTLEENTLENCHINIGHCSTPPSSSCLHIFFPHLRLREGVVCWRAENFLLNSEILIHCRDNDDQTYSLVSPSSSVTITYRWLGSKSGLIHPIVSKRDIAENGPFFVSL